MSLVSVLVPEELVLDVYRLISGGPAAASDPLGPPTSDSWTPELVQRCFRESPPTMKAIFRILASRPGKELVLEDFMGPVSKAAGKKYGWRELMGVLGAFGRRCKNRYGQQTPPFEAKWNHERKVVLYRMNVEVARVISGSES